MSEWFLEKYVIPGKGQNMYKMSWKHLVIPGGNKLLKTNEVVPTEPEEALTDPKMGQLEQQE